jgi:antitoxin FitA
MPDLRIRNISRTTRKRLNARASDHGTTIEAEARAILDNAVARPNLADVAERLFGLKGGVVLDNPPRHPMRQPR